MKRGILRGMFLSAIASAAIVAVACSSSDSSSPSDAGADVKTPPAMPPPPPDDSGNTGPAWNIVVTDVNGKGLPNVQTCIVDHPEIACVTTGPTGDVRIQGPPTDNFTLGFIGSQGKAAYAIDGQKLAALLTKNGVLFSLVYATLSALDGGAQDPAKGSVLIGQAGIALLPPTARAFQAQLMPSGGTEIDDPRFMGFANVTPGPVTIALSPMTMDAGPDADASTSAASCGNVGIGVLAWDTTADPSKESGRVYADYTLIFAASCD